jgi:hypothetical protein
VNQPKGKDTTVKQPSSPKPEQSQAAQPAQTQTPATGTTDAKKADASRPTDSAVKQTPKANSKSAGAANPNAKQSSPPAQAKPNPEAQRSAPGAGKTAASPAAEPNVPVGLNDPVRQGLSANLYMDASGNAVPVYHFTSVSSTPGGAADSKQHFCTIDEQEKYKLIDTQPSVWKYEGIAFFAYPTGEGRQPPGARPVYRFDSESLNRHFFTMDEAQKQMLIDKLAKVWQYKGVAWYAPPAKSSEKK